MILYFMLCDIYTVLVPSRTHNSSPLLLCARTELSNIVDDLLLHAFFLQKKFCINIFASQNFAHLFRRVLFFLLSKINVQILLHKQL